MKNVFSGKNRRTSSTPITAGLLTADFRRSGQIFDWEVAARRRHTVIRLRQEDLGRLNQWKRWNSAFARPVDFGYNADPTYHFAEIFHVKEIMAS